MSSPLLLQQKIQQDIKQIDNSIIPNVFYNDVINRNQQNLINIIKLNPNLSLNVIKSIDRIDDDWITVTNLYTKPENCIVPTETWKKAINKVKQNNRSIKNYEKIAFQSFYPHREFNRDIAKRIAEKTVLQFGKRKIRLNLNELKRDLKKVLKIN